MKTFSRVLIALGPNRHEPWWPFDIRTHRGAFGRIRWINSEPAEDAWGDTWWSPRHELSGYASTVFKAFVDFIRSLSQLLKP